MIGMLKGTVVRNNSSSLIIDVHDVGYKVFVPQALLRKQLQEEVTLFTHTHVREDILELYGFLSNEDLSLFENLISVSGIGCKSALGVFSIGSRQHIIQAIMKGDAGFFTGVPRLGKKNAQKIIIELKNKIGSSVDLDLGEGQTDHSDVLDTLQALGFSQQEAREALNTISESATSTEEKVRLALKQLSK